MADLDFEARDDIWLSSDAAAHGASSALQRAARRGEAKRVRRGAYASTEKWEEQSELQRYMSRISAVEHTRHDAVFSSFSAAALHDLPCIGHWPETVHLLSPSSAGGKNRNGVAEHYRRGDEQISVIGGFAATALVPTIIELARVASFAWGVAAADAALKIPRLGDPTPRATRPQLEDAYHRRLPFPGSRKVRAVLDFATTQADTPLESLSRVVIHEEGFEAPTLQHRLWLPHSRRWIYLDFAWLAYSAFGEADGNGKYLGSEDLSGLDPAAVVVAEKKREDEVRALSNGVARWDWTEALGRRILRAKLIQLGIPVVRRPRSGHPGSHYVAPEPFRRR